MKIRSRLLTRIVAGTASALVKLLGSTCREVVRIRVPGTNPLDKSCTERFLYCSWHDSLLLPIIGTRSPDFAALVSRHQDGSYLAEAMRRLDVMPVRGSTSRGGAQAMRQMMDLAEDKHIMITPDGPRGPRRKMKSGIVFLASKTGRRIVPTAYSPTRYWRIRGSWTDQLIPKPYCTIYKLAGEPIVVPANINRDEMAYYTDTLQRAMDDLQTEADRLAAGIPESDHSEKRAA